ncbi:MAG TPA: glycosyltransferase family A protein [Pyrinomonadaceae bacterium]|jgi:glycosyltransferase involved in cell wall biosynthesis
MLVSAVIPTFNAAEYLREAIESVLAQTRLPDEIIVVDDGSTDHTGEVCASFGERLKYIYQENDGTMGAGSRARAMFEAGGEWIAIMDHDDRWLPAKLERQLEAARAFPEARAILTERRVINGQGETTFEPENLSGKAFQLSSHEAFHAFLRESRYSVSSGLLRRSFLKEHGLTDPARVGVADWDLWLSVARHYPLVVVDQVLTEYRLFAEQTVSDKRWLAEALQKTLDAQREHLHPNCAECRKSFRAGQAYVAQVFDNAARVLLDQYHAQARDGQLPQALPFLWRAVKASPQEILRPRRLAAISKSYVIGNVKRRQEG